MVCISYTANKLLQHAFKVIERRSDLPVNDGSVYYTVSRQTALYAVCT